MNNEDKILTLLGTMSGQLETMNGRLDTMDGRLDKLEAGQDGLWAEMKTVQHTLTDIKTEQADIKYELETVRHSVTVMENDHGNAIKALFDVVKNTQERFDRQDHLELLVDNHGSRIFALEQAVNS